MNETPREGETWVLPSPSGVVAEVHVVKVDLMKRIVSYSSSGAPDVQKLELDRFCVHFQPKRVQTVAVPP